MMCEDEVRRLLTERRILVMAIRMIDKRLMYLSKKYGLRIEID